MSEKSPEKKENSSKTASRAFAGRMATYEVGAVSDKDASPLRSLDGAFLKRYEIANFFKDALYSEAKITNRKIGTHLLEYFVEEKLATLASARNEASKQMTDEAEEQRDAAGEALISEMQAILSAPEQYGIDIQKQYVDRAKLQYVSEDGDEDNYDTLDSYLRDEDNVPDPFYVNGMLPRTKVISDACKRIYEKWYPVNEGDDHTARLLIKDRCIDQVIRELEQLEQNRTKEKVSSADKPTLIDEKVQKLTTLMRQLSQQEYLDAYLNVIAFGPHHSGSSKLPKDMMQLDTLYKRLPFNFAKKLDEGPERAERRIAFYRTLYSNMDSGEQEIAIQEFDDGKNTFFRDNVGQVSPASAYAKMEMIFRAKGFTDEEITQSCAAYMEDVVAKMVAFEKKYNELHTQREVVGSNDELVELNKEIKRMKGDGRGQLRKEMLAEAKKVVGKLEFIRVAPIENTGDNLAILDGTSNDLEKENQSIFVFNYDTLSNWDARVEEGGELLKRVDTLLKTSLHSGPGNVAGDDNSYVEMRDALMQERTKFMQLLDTSVDPEQKAVEVLVNSIESNVIGMIAKIEEATIIIETEKGKVDSLQVTA